MTAAIGRLEATSRRAVILMVIGLAVIGGALGAALGVAHAKDVTCSHVLPGCFGSWGDDNIQGWENINEIVAESGYDYAWGKGAYDIMLGESEADGLFGGEGDDLVYGGYGNDNYYKHSTTDSYGVWGNSGWDRIEGNVGHDLVVGDYGQDGMYGGDNEDWLWSEDAQPDTVQGGGQQDACWVDGKDSFAGCEIVY